MQDLDFIIQRSILKTGNRLLNIRSDNLKAFDLTANQSETLLFFDRNPGAIILELKGYLQISHQAARNLVARMKEKELLYAVVSDTDARAKKIYLSEKGRAICSQLKNQGSRVGSRLLCVLTEEEKKELLHLLEKITDHI